MNGERSERGDRDDRRDHGRSDRSDRDRGDRRRRSRSPDHRGARGSRREPREPREPREGGPDADSYSSSRSHRDREREDRYSGGRGGDRRDRDPWGGDRDRERDRGDRDRGDRDRDRRRDRHGGRGGRGGDDDDDDRRGDRRRRGGDRDDRDSHRKRSASPPPKKREPTPDLTDVTSVLERKRRLTQWDMKPPGYESVTAEQAKLSGMFPLPGAPRQQQQMDPSKLQAFIAQPAAAASTNAAAASVLKPTNSRQAKRLLVANLPAGTGEDALVAFFNLQLNGLNVIDGTDPCVQAQLSNDKSFALMEFRDAADATVALALDGITMEADDDTAMTDGANGSGPKKGLQLSRPKDYIVPAVVDYGGYQSGVVSTVVVDTPNKISITNIPPYLTDEQVTELLVAFGELRAFVLAKDRSSDESRGIAFCEYVEPASTEIAIQGLNGMDLGDRKLRVQKASVGIAQAAGMELGVNAMSMLAGTVAVDATDVSRVVQLLNMVTADELVDNEDYEEIRDDVREECEKFGKVTGLKVPRPSGGSRQSAGVGKIFVKFETPDMATKALKALAGRKFSDRTVIATYFPEENFEVDAW
ncbi:hypothetical protein Sste5346_008803 [Sporothrix stenoceras]|uniref:Splicing factor U2AF subunit n=1 Tax=Sporothrix stenoceras TaxID=5173 RepID=A0ABR3YMH4_9PEZI